MWRVISFQDLRKKENSPFYNSVIAQISTSLALFFGKSPKDLIHQFIKILLAKGSEKIYENYNQKIVETFDLLKKGFTSLFESIYCNSEGILYHVLIETSFFIEKSDYSGVSFGYVKKFEKIDSEQQISNIINSPKFFVINPIN